MSDPGIPAPDRRDYPAAPQRKSGARAVRPKDAASLVLIRKTPAGMEVLMGRRHKKTRFMPDVFVFPGGRLDAADARAKPATALKRTVEAHLMRSATTARARALAMAAVRETYEETGLLLGAEGSVGGTRDAGWDAVRQTGMAPDLARLDYVGRAITRAASPIRFDARFFLADADHFTGELAGSGELLDLAFLPLDQARELRSAVITQFILSEVTRLGDASAAQRAKRAEYRWSGSERVVTYV